MTLADRVVELGRMLERAGVPVGIAATIDAVRAIEHLDLTHRTELREGLRATLVKQSGHRATFDAAFDRLFPLTVDRTGGSGPPLGTSPAEIAAAVAGGEDLRAVAGALVDAHAGLDGELRSEQHHVQRVLRAADLARMMSRARIHDPTVAPEQLRRRIDELKRLVAADVRGRLGPGDDRPVGPDLVDVEFLHASRAELASMRAAIAPLARKLASRLARRRQHRRGGRVNVRQTIRRSLGTGGTPFDVVHHRPRPRRPELVVLCDVSGSVADFSLFTLTLVSALSAELARTRTFVFVDAVDEITGLLRSTDHQIEPWQLMRNTSVIGSDGHTDHRAVFEQLLAEHPDALGPHTALLVTGDARNNHRDPGTDAWAQVTARCRRVDWLNPEPSDAWDTEDSVMRTYAACCTSVHEVRTLRQLVACVERLV